MTDERPRVIRAGEPRVLDGAIFGDRDKFLAAVREIVHEIEDRLTYLGGVMAAKVGDGELREAVVRTRSFLREQLGEEPT